MAHHILLVDDDDDLRREVKDLLTDEGYDVDTAANGKEALSRLQGPQRPCLILLDLMMPVMNGWDFRGAQLKEPALAQIPTVILSGVPQSGDNLGKLLAADFIRKPFSVDRLLSAIEQYC